MAIRTPTFQGQSRGIIEGRFPVPTPRVSGGRQVDTGLLKRRAALDLVGGIQTIMNDISTRHSATQYQELTSDFISEELTLYEDTTNNVNGYASFRDRGTQGHAELVKKYEQRAKEAGLNPEFITKLKGFTSNSSVKFENNLVSLASRTEPKVLANRTDNLIAKAIINMKGSHPDNRNTSVREELFSTLDKMSGVLGTEWIKGQKRKFNKLSERAFFDSTVLNNPGFFLEDVSEVTFGDVTIEPFQFKYHNSGEVASFINEAKRVYNSIEKARKENIIIDNSNTTKAMDRVSLTQESLGFSLRQLSPKSFPAQFDNFKRQSDEFQRSVEQIRKQIESTLSLDEKERQKYLDKLDEALVANSNRREFASVINVLKNVTSTDGVEEYKNQFMQWGNDLPIGPHKSHFIKNHESVIAVFDEHKKTLGTIETNSKRIKKFQEGGISPDTPEGKKAIKNILSRINLPPSGWESFRRGVAQTQGVDVTEVPQYDSIVPAIVDNLLVPGTMKQGMGFVLLAKTMEQTKTVPDEVLAYYSNNINRPRNDETDDLKVGRLIQQIVKLRESNYLTDDALKNAKLFDPYIQYAGNLILRHPVAIGSEMRDINTRSKELSGLPGAQVRDIISQNLDRLYDPNNQDGALAHITAAIGGKINPNSVSADQIGKTNKEPTWRRLWSALYRAIKQDPHKAAKQDIRTFVDNEEINFLEQPGTQQQILLYHQRLARMFTTKGHDAENASKLAALQISREFAPTSFNDTGWGYLMPDNPTVNNSGNTPLEHENSFTVFLQKHIKTNPVLGLNIEDAFIKAEVTKTTKIFDIGGDTGEYRVGGVTLLGVKVPFWGDEYPAYVKRLIDTDGKTMSDTGGEFYVLNSEKIRLMPAQKDLNGNNAYPVQYKHPSGEWRFLLGKNNRTVVYIPNNSKDNRLFQEEERLKRINKWGGQLLNNTGRALSQGLEFIVNPNPLEAQKLQTFSDSSPGNTQ